MEFPAVKRKAGALLQELSFIIDEWILILMIIVGHKLTQICSDFFSFLLSFFPPSLASGGLWRASRKPKTKKNLVNPVEKSPATGG
jgi:hypothetical protein